MLQKPIVTVQPSKASLPKEDIALLLRYLRHPRERCAIIDTLSTRIDSLFRAAGQAQMLQVPVFADKMRARAATLKTVLWKVREIGEADVKALME